MKAIELKKRLDKEFPQTVFFGEEVAAIQNLRLPSGSFVFDMITGGGIPKNKFTIFHGPKSSSKTTFALRIAGMYQEMNKTKNVLFMDFEQSFDWEWAGNYIPDRSRMEVVRPDYGEVGIDILKIIASEAEDVGLVIIDSLASINPTKEAEAAAGDYTQLGLQVRLINRMIRILIPIMSQASKRPDGELTVLTINQIRANMNKSGPYSPSFSQPCGKFLEHAASMDIRFYPAEHTVSKGVPYKAKHKFMVDKNKVGGQPKRSGEFMYYLLSTNGYQTGELEEDKVVLTYAKRAGVVQRDGNKWIIPSTKREPLVFGSMVEVTKAFREDLKLFNAVKRATLKACLENPLLSADEEGE